MHKKAAKGTIMVLTPRTGTETFTERIREILKKSLQYSTHDLVESQMSVEGIFDLCTRNNTETVIFTTDWLLQESEKKHDLLDTITGLAASDTHVVLVLKRNPEVVSNLSIQETRLKFVLNQLNSKKGQSKSESERKTLKEKINLFTEHSQAAMFLTQMFDQRKSAN